MRSVYSPARAAAQAPEDHAVELGLMLWRPSPELVLSTDALAGSNITEVDVVQEFGLEDGAFPEFRAVFGRHHKVRLSYVKSDYDADATVQRTFTFQGRTFTVGTPASSDIEWDLWKFGYEWDSGDLKMQGPYFGVTARF